MGMEIDFAKVSDTELGAQSRVVTANLIASGQTGDDENAETFSGEEVFQPLGLASRPECTEHTEALVVRYGDQALVLCLIDKGAALYTATPGTLEKGETRLYGAKEPSAVIRIRADGSIEITPKPGTDLVLNGGTLKVARQTDGVNKSTLMGAWMAQVETAVNALAPGAVTPLSGTFSGIGEISAGASHVKA